MALDDIQWEAWKDVRARGSAIRELERALDNSGLSKEAQRLGTEVLNEKLQICIWQMGLYCMAPRKGIILDI
jgi:hypothetical protein